MKRICLLFWLCLTSAAQAATITVTNTTDSGAGSLRNAISNANPGDTIVFTNTLSGRTIYLTSGELLVTDDLTIDASALTKGIIIDAGQNSRVLEITPENNVILASLTLTNGFAAGGGGMAVDSGATLIANNCAICGNSVTNGYGAGGIYNGYIGTITLNYCTISNNCASTGGGIDNDGILTLNNCILSGNYATNGPGGGINNNVTVTFNNCLLSGNFATNGPGGGIENFNTVTLNNSTLANNSASDGGGIYTEDGSILTLYNCTLSGNLAINGFGGGIASDYGTLVLTNTIVAGNTAFSYNNISGVVFWGANNLTNGDPHLAPLGNYGGPTQTMPPLSGSPVIDGGTDSVTNFLATDQRGYPRLSGGHVDIGAVEYESSLVVTTNADSGVGSLRDVMLAVAPGGAITFSNTLSGQTIHLASGELVISENLTIDASALAGGVVIDAGKSSRVLEITSGTVKLNSLTLTNGYLFGDGGGAFVDGGATLTINNCTLAGNIAYDDGGGIYIYAGGTITFDNCTLASNASGKDGGGIYIYYDSAVMFNNCTLAGNFAYDGAGLYSYAGPPVTLNNCTLAGNISSDDGGGIYAGAVLSMTNTIVAGNAAYNGPNIYGPYSGANNFIGGNPLLAPLGNYGGPTQTMPPFSGAPAIDAGTDSVTNFLTTDQRGLPRLSGAHVDIGAAEAQFGAADANNPPVLTNPVGGSVSGGSGTFQFTFTNSADVDFTALASTNLALPLADWMVLGNVTETSPGQYQFTDANATSSPQRYYRVVSP